MAQKQPIDDRVLRAAQRAIARARGQEQISVEPVHQEPSPSASARLYKVSQTGSMPPVRTEACSAAEEPVEDAIGRDGGDEAEATAEAALAAALDIEPEPPEPREVEPEKLPDGHEGATASFPRHREEEASVAVPRGSAADAFVESSPSGSAAKPTPDATAGYDREAGGWHRSRSQRHVAPASDPNTTAGLDDAALTKALEPKSRYADRNVYREESGPVPRVPKEHKLSAGLPTLKRSVPEEAGLFLDTFFAQLKHCGVRNVVVSPGSQSTPLAMKAYEHYGDVYMDVDERGAAFFALGLAKATGNAVALVCTSGSAVGNWMPAVLEAEASRVPLLLLSADKPPRLQGVGAPQTCDQLHLFGGHVKKFMQMPLPSASEETLAYARQMALDACIAAHGARPNVASADAGPVHLNFPFEEPLTPAPCADQVEVAHLPASVVAGQGLLAADAAGLFKLIKGKRVIALCGEGTCESADDARALLDFARMRYVPLLADPLSGLRCYSDSMIVDHYDAIFGGERAPHAEVVVRFGRWPISERAMQAVQKMDALQIVVDLREPRDITSSTTLFVRCSPTVFAEAMAAFDSKATASTRACKEWCELNNEAAETVRGVRLRRDNGEMEGAYVYETVEAAPEGSLLFCANSMSIRALDTFYCKADKQLRVLCNRGLGGVDGTISSAIGAAQAYDQTTLIIGDLAFLRDVNALALQNEMRLRELHTRKPTPSIIVVLLNNNGAGLFDMLPQKSSEPYFERLFLTPQAVDFKRIADGFGVTCRTVSSVNSFRRTYSSLIGEAGINIIEVLVPLAGVAKRYGDYWKL